MSIVLVFMDMLSFFVGGDIVVYEVVIFCYFVILFKC